jgi:hypothetical protein
VAQDSASRVTEAPQPRVLIVVSSAGVNPWLEIEEEAQAPIIRDLMGDTSEVIWMEGNRELLPLIRFRVLDWLIRQQLGIMYRRWYWFRRIYKNSWDKYEWNAIGSGFLRKLLENNASGAKPQAQSSRVTRDFPIQMSLAGARTLDVLRYSLQQHEFDYLLRLTSTCLPVPSELRALLGGLPRTRVYGGVQAKFARTSFVSGAAVLLSRDVVEGICENSRSFSYLVFEDVGLGRIVRKKNLADLIVIPRVDVTSIDQIPGLVSASWPKAPVVRCKAEHPLTTRSGPVVELMKAVAPHLS